MGYCRYEVSIVRPPADGRVTGWLIDRTSPLDNSNIFSRQVLFVAAVLCFVDNVRINIHILSG